MSNVPPPPPPGDGPPPGGDAPWWAQAGSGGTPNWWNEPGPPPGAYQAPQGHMPFSPGSDPAYAQTYWRGQKTMAKGAVTSLVVGLLSLFCCGIVLGPIAIVQGSQARFRVRTSNGRLSGDGIALLGMFLGGLSVFLFFFWLWWYATGHSVLVIQRGGTTGG
jgi:Domain of unknown function (DUF4190)